MCMVELLKLLKILEQKYVHYDMKTDILEKTNLFCFVFRNNNNGTTGFLFFKHFLRLLFSSFSLKAVTPP